MDNVEDSYKHYNEIEESWKTFGGLNRDYEHLSGTEVSHDPITNQFSFLSHSKAISIKDPKYGRLRGNMNYKEDRFDIQINPMVYVQKNENWENVPPIAIVGALPNDIVTTSIEVNAREKISQLQGTEIENIYTPDLINTGAGWSSRKETKFRDKCIKVRIRYKGDKLAIIHAIQTLYTISYS